MGCTSGAVKCFLNTVNVLWGLGSILILAGGALLMGTAPTLIIYFLFVIGAVGLVASLLGCFGICQEHICMTASYAALILLSLILQVCCIIFSRSIEGVRKYADEDVTKAWEMEIKQEGAMDFIQTTFQCCGKDSFHDYESINRTFPKSCYSKKPGKETELNNYGCILKAEEGYVNAVNSLLGGSWGTIIFTVVMLIFAIYLIVRFRRKRRHYNY